MYIESDAYFMPLTERTNTKTDLKMLIKLIKINKNEKRGKLSTGQVFAVLACQLHINN